MDKAAWAAWAQAIFSVLAILSAVWIARADDRRRQRDALELAEGTAMHVLQCLSSVQGFAEACLEGLAKEEVAGGEFKRRANQMAELPLPTFQDAHNLLVAKRGIASGLLQYIGTLDTAKIMLGRVGEQNGPLGERQQRASNVYFVLQPVPDLAKLLRSNLEEFLKERGNTVYVREFARQDKQW